MRHRVCEISQSQQINLEFYQERDKIVLSMGAAGLFTQSSLNRKYYKHQYEKVITVYSKFQPIFFLFCILINNTFGVGYENKSFLDSLRGHIGYFMMQYHVK